ncbi:intermembrane phospholipid transport protein YdbH family protein [Novosphingobium aquimarinum]|uniref:intermembrane phospholipid transport protein YdbH family protein n=1 Tax=Novosphingobium aquimarinum TaxID=2682494 RepID=UPI0018DC45F7|nr:YdbH domain-containing protein [Novosphingobium aquimarinum]
MAQEEYKEYPDAERGTETRYRSRGCLLLVSLTLIVSLVLLYLWIQRERIADDYIAEQLETMGLPATYDVVEIGPDKQVLRNLVVGDPARPDLTVERIELKTRIGFGLPGIGRITLTEPRFYGRIRNGTPSFGSLDKVLFTGGDAPFRMPDLDVAIEDGRALIEADQGPIGIKLAGEGRLRGGFSGILAAVTPGLAQGDCRTGRTTLYAKLSVSREKPRLQGPLRTAGLVCPKSELRLGQSALALDLVADQHLDGLDGKLGVELGKFAYAGQGMEALQGTAAFSFRKSALNARYDLAALGAGSPQARAARISAQGRLRTLGALERIELESDLQATGVAGGEALFAALESAQDAGEGTLLASVAAQIRTALAREARGSRFDGNVVVRRTEDGTTLVIPRATLRGGSGATLLAVSRFQALAGTGGDLPQLSGNFSTGGRGLPSISGRMERDAGDRLLLRVRMPEYVAGDARLALPELTVVQAADGGFTLDGQARVSGALPGGSATNLVLPIDGRVARDGSFALWRQCVQLRFDRLSMASLQLDRQRMPLCPARGQAIVSNGGGGLRIAAGTTNLDVRGSLGATPIRIASGPVGVAWPGNLSARSLEVTLGPAATASTFRIANLAAQLDNTVAGTFEKSDVTLYAVPLDIRDASGTWRYAGGVLTLGSGQFRLEDRQQVDRFEPLLARDATLRLADNLITADALLREPKSDRQIVRAVIRHNLATGRGQADLDVPSIVFDAALQPDTLTTLALGVIANAQGAVRGSGRIDWSPQAVTSRGQFTTDRLDFAAAFGPVTGMQGTVEFSDLLGLVTPPGQTLRIAAINPGIEVNDGILKFGLRPGYVIAVEGADWPFFGGSLHLEPVTMTMGKEELRRYTLVIRGLEAERFLARMELANLSATGTFDGEMPLLFDKNGGRIEGGLLESRPPGGNVSYVGDLSYEDLSTMANFAFDTLRSLDYRRMVIGMDGALEGELLTKMRIHGVSQGEGARKNFLTRRIGKLPIQFNINMRAPFFQLVSSFKSLYDPAYVRDPRGLGLIDENGKPIDRRVRQTGADPLAADSSSAVQPPESEDMP